MTQKAHVALLAIMAFTAGSMLSAFLYGQLPGLPRKGGGWDDFAATYQKIRQRHLGNDVDDDALLRGAADGMVKALDDKYSRFYPPDETERVQKTMDGKIGGIGLQLRADDRDNLVVERTFPDSPAAAADVRKGDVLIAVGDVAVAGPSLEHAVESIKGEVGTPVQVTFRRPGKEAPVIVTLTRAEIVVPSVSWTVTRSDGVPLLVVTIDDFHSDTGELFAKALAEGRDASARAVVIDLRGNGGGYMREAGLVACAWFDDAPYARTRERAGEPQPYVCKRPAVMRGVPVAVIIDGGTASAAEIVAGALQDEASAVVIGTKSFGKGEGQSTFDLPSGSSLKLTTFEWTTPRGRSIHKVGILPSREAVRTRADARAGKDPPLELALRCLAHGCPDPARP